MACSVTKIIFCGTLVYPRSGLLTLWGHGAPSPGTVGVFSPVAGSLPFLYHLLLGFSLPGAVHGVLVSWSLLIAGSVGPFVVAGFAPVTKRK